MNSNYNRDNEEHDSNDICSSPDNNNAKQHRFNLRNVNLPPLKRDHSRSMDYSSRQAVLRAQIISAEREFSKEDE